MAKLSRYFLSVAVTATVLLSAGCASTYSPSACKALDPEEYTETYDPFESFNRSVFDFNLSLDKTLLAPLARGYKRITPDPVETGISSFYRNLKEPRNMVSSVLSGQLEITAKSGLRFTLNTTAGLLGFIDVADKAGINYENYDFGHMLGHWGVGPGVYFVYPVAGPTNSRDSFGSLIHLHTTYVENRIKKSEHQLLVQAGSYVNTRANLLTFTDMLADQPDPYLFARESYRQSRLDRICNP